MNNFYEQHAAVEPWLKVDKYPEDGKEILQSPEQRFPFRFLSKFHFVLYLVSSEPNWMGCMSAFFVLVAVLLVLPIGGMVIVLILVRLFFFRRTDGSLTQGHAVISKEKDSNIIF